MSSQPVNRRQRRLELALERALEALLAAERHLLQEQTERHAEKREHSIAVRRLEDTIVGERLKRVSAQRGLVAYMREHGMGNRIGYDPDKDPIIQAEIARGEIPPSFGKQDMQTIARQMVAAKEAER